MPLPNLSQQMGPPHPACPKKLKHEGFDVHCAIKPKNDKQKNVARVFLAKLFLLPK